MLRSVAIQDCIEVAGLRTTAGARSRAETVSIENGLVAQRVLEAGAVLMGKTNVSPNASDWNTDNAVFGRTNNPWDLSRTPGGSTGGGAAALAAGLTPLEFGSDTAGSIRIPPAHLPYFSMDQVQSQVSCITKEDRLRRRT